MMMIAVAKQLVRYCKGEARQGADWYPRDSTTKLEQIRCFGFALGFAESYECDKCLINFAVKFNLF